MAWLTPKRLVATMPQALLGWLLAEVLQNCGGTDCIFVQPPEAQAGRMMRPLRREVAGDARDAAS